MFAKSIAWALLLSISSVSWVISLQLWIWYHVTMWDCIDAMWSRRIDIDAKVQDLLQFFLWDQRGSEIDCPGLKPLSCPVDVSLSLFLFCFHLPPPDAHLTSPGMAGGQLVVPHWDGSTDTESTVRCCMKDNNGSRGKASPETQQHTSPTSALTLIPSKVFHGFWHDCVCVSAGIIALWMVT